MFSSHHLCSFRSVRLVIGIFEYCPCICDFPTLANQTANPKPCCTIPSFCSVSSFSLTLPIKYIAAPNRPNIVARSAINAGSRKLDNNDDDDDTNNIYYCRSSLIVPFAYNLLPDSGKCLLSEVVIIVL
jgi:hypothetical protein